MAVCPCWRKASIPARASVGGLPHHTVRGQVLGGIAEAFALVDRVEFHL